MPTSSITHNFTINDVSSIEKFAKALDNPKYEKSDIPVKYITSPDELRVILEKWKNHSKAGE
jgi:hypothetical protein